jgi:glutathione S-transferase
MKLLYAPRSPFALKVRILIHELGFNQKVGLVPIDPWADETLRSLNPLCKVPTLVLDSGEALYDSPVICEYLDQAAGGAAFPRGGSSRWTALRRQSLADGLAEAVIRRFVERLGPVTERSEKVAIRQEAAIGATLDALDAESAIMPSTPTIGEIATAAALMYLSFRSPEIAWPQRRGRLAAWYTGFVDRASCRAIASDVRCARSAGSHPRQWVPARY